MYQSLKSRMTHFAIVHPRRVVWAMVATTLLIVAAAILPSLLPAHMPGHGIVVDTDPENMLSEHEAVRVFNEEAKARFGLYDVVVVGVTNERHPQGVFNVASLTRVYELSEFAKSLQWSVDDDKSEGVVAVDILAPSNVDYIEQGGLGSVSFSWLMEKPPVTEKQAWSVLEKAQSIPFLDGTLTSEDGRAIALYLPITSKDLSYQIAQKIEEYTADWSGQGDQVFITGLPVAEDTFGVEMFIQMAISAPAAMLVIFVLLWWFFKKLVLVVSPMIVAMVCSLVTMGLLVITGNTIHIMSSMIPIFIMPIAVLDSVHILSEFFDRYPKYKDRRKTLEVVYEELFAPMLFTTLTTVAGFASLALTPIPPVAVFGAFVSVGVLLAWVWTMLFVPAYIMLLPEKALQGYGNAVGEGAPSLLDRILKLAGVSVSRRPSIYLLSAVAMCLIAVIGIRQIQVNDNPMRWFDENHKIRQADRVLNDHFAGTYQAYLQVSAEGDASLMNVSEALREIQTRQQEGLEFGNPEQPYQSMSHHLTSLGTETFSLPELIQWIAQRLDEAEGDHYYSWDDIQLMADGWSQRSQVFKQPEILRWMEELQQAFEDQPVVGKVNSLTDVVKTVYRELQLGDAQQFRVPETSAAVGQTLITYQNSHRPQDLWHFVTPDYRHSVLWLQLTSGDNRDMESVLSALDRFLEDNPPPVELKSEWFGLTYINVVWQNKMVIGMLESFLGSFLVVLLMMVILFRSFVWAALAMIPLVVTVGLIYGIIGLIGKDYDMPVAILSALSLGLAVDYAIHFLVRAREMVEQLGSWKTALPQMFGEPARAISRNAIILGAGFTPLLIAPLVPYQTVGVFIAAIIVSAAVVTLLLLPALMTLLRSFLFSERVES